MAAADPGAATGSGEDADPEEDLDPEEDDDPVEGGDLGGAAEVEPAALAGAARACAARTPRPAPPGHTTIPATPPTVPGR